MCFREKESNCEIYILVITNPKTLNHLVDSNAVTWTNKTKEQKMKRHTSFPTYKITFWTCFVPSLTYIFFYEFLLTKYPSSSDTIFKLGLIFKQVSYSITAASIFYFVTQYIGIFIPKEQKKIKILPIVNRNAVIVDAVLGGLKLNLGYDWGDVKDSDKFRKALDKINTDSPVDNFENWYHYLFFIKSQLLELTRAMAFHNDVLSKEFFQELLIIEQRLMSPITFAVYKVLAVSNLSYAELDLRELFIHNQHLQQLREKEFKKYEKEFDKDSKDYRATYYQEVTKK